MHELTLYNIDQISRDVARQEITFSHLQADLIDHICCDVENEMSTGLSFSQAYQKVKRKIGSRGLKEIHEETLYLVDIKYRIMKNVMKISGTAGTILFGFAALFKIQHWPMAGIIMTAGAMILSLIFLPSAIGVLWKETHNARRLFLFISGFFAGLFSITGTLFKIQHWNGAGWLLLLAGITGIIFFIPAFTISRIKDQADDSKKRPVYIIGSTGIILYCLGMLFKIQHWPLATSFMIIGVILACVIALPWYTWLTWKDSNYVSFRFIYLIAGTLSLIIPGMVINLNLQNSYNAGYYSNQNQQQALYSYTSALNEEYLKRNIDSPDYREMEQLHSYTKDLVTAIGNIQMKMIDDSEGRIHQQNVTLISLQETVPQINYNLLSRPFHNCRDLLMPGSSLLPELDLALRLYTTHLSELPSYSMFRDHEKMIAASLYIPSPEINEITLMSALHSMELLKNSIVSFESYSFKVISDN